MSLIERLTIRVLVQHLYPSSRARRSDLSTQISQQRLQRFVQGSSRTIVNTLYRLSRRRHIDLHVQFFRCRRSKLLQRQQAFHSLLLVPVQFDVERSDCLGRGKGLEVKLCDNAVGGAGAAESPVQVGHLPVCRVPDRAVGEDDGGANESVESEAVGS